MRVPLVVSLLAACASSAPPPAPHQPPVPVDPDPPVEADLHPPAPELARDAGHPLAIPPPPAFELPPPSADGAHAVRELRVAGKPLLDSAVTVRGVVTWVYDCVGAVRKPGEADAAARKRIDADPTLCERPKFYVGDAATTPREKSLWVVDVPRPYNKLELERIKRPERTMPDRCEPADKDKPTSVCVPYKVGDEVLITGTWALQSPHAERNSDGLLVYARMKNLTQRRESPGGGAAVVASPAVKLPAAATVTPADTTKRPIARVRTGARTQSLAAADEGVRAYGQRQLDTAIEAFTRAIDRWHDNHRAWYALAAAYGQRGEWAKAADAAGTAVELVPDAAMYHLAYARALYQKQLQQDADTSVINFEKVQSHAAAAIALEPALWRAHALLGQTHRHAGRARDAAAELTKAVALGPAEPEPWIALAELYRAWDYDDAAIAVCMLATTTAQPVADVWFELGLAYDDKRVDDKAIDAFTRAADAGQAKALFARGQVYFRAKKYGDARRDLEQFVQVRDAPEPYKAQAQRMLADMGRR